MRLLHSLLVLLSLISFCSCGIYQKYYEEAYKIAVGMTLEQKIGQCLQVDFYGINNKKTGTDPAEAIKYHLGSLLVGGDGTPDENGNLIEIP